MTRTIRDVALKRRLDFFQAVATMRDGTHKFAKVCGRGDTHEDQVRDATEKTHKLALFVGAVKIDIKEG